MFIPSVSITEGINNATIYTLLLALTIFTYLLVADSTYVLMFLATRKVSKLLNHIYYAFQLDMRKQLKIISSKAFKQMHNFYVTK